MNAIRFSNCRLHWLTLVLICFMAAPAHACLNDRDTVAVEMAGLPDVAQVVSGHFETNPPLYYQMRIDRIKAELTKGAILFAEYDDAAVACDRIGNDDAAIEWIEKKHALLPAYDAGNEKMKEQWYRYYANAGTFWVHRWLRGGAHIETIAQMDTAATYIKAALAIKPNAHFGREGCQLVVIEWIADTVKSRIAHANTGSDEEARTIAYDFDDRLKQIAARNHFDPLTALCGLVVLGNAWESPDVFSAIGRQVTLTDQHSLATMAFMRACELTNTGHHSIVGLTDQQMLNLSNPSFLSQIEVYPQMQKEYAQYRRDADHWRADRDTYMASRLARGDHPDTDEHFWDDYRETASTAPSPSVVDRVNYMVFGEGSAGNGPALLCILVCMILIVFICRQAIKDSLQRSLARHRREL